MSGLSPNNIAGLAAMARGAIMPNANLSSQPLYGNANNPSVGKKAVHVKWAGKTIALGTFPHAEADEKCARAKALTRAWRSTMRPKPTRQWVMLELERLQVRVVSGRTGRKDDDDEGDDDDDDDDDNANDAKKKNSKVNGAGGNEGSKNGKKYNSDKGRNSSKNDDSPIIPPHRPLVGGGSAAAYEAARADHYMNIAEQKSVKKKNKSESKDKPNDVNISMASDHMCQMKAKMNNNNNNNRLLSQTPVAMPQLGLTINPNQHYEMLKLHHMNLLNEIQETTLMMNLYKQQQQQMADHQALAGQSADPQLALQLAQQQQASTTSPFLESLYGMGASNPMNPSHQFPYQPGNQFPQMQQGAPNQFGLGFGAGAGMGPMNNQMHALLRQQQTMLSGGMNGVGVQYNQMKNKLDDEAKIEQLKQDISDRQRQVEDMEKNVKEKRGLQPLDTFGAKKQKKKA